MRKHLANLVTSCRILCSIGLLFCPVFSVPFYLLYLLCGSTDMIDGTIARKTNSVTLFGSKLDSAADLIFLIAACIKLLPVVHLPGWLWCWIILIGIIRTSKGKLLLEHTLLNKITGLLLFVLPLTLSFLEVRFSTSVVCAIATVSAIQDKHTKTPAH